MQSRMVPTAGGTVNALPHVSTKIPVANVSKEQINLPEGMLIDLGPNPLEAIVNLDQAAIISLDQREDDKPVAATVAAEHQE